MDTIYSFGLLFYRYASNSVKRRWQVNANYGHCDIDAGWLVVLDTDHSPDCSWDNKDGYPAFLYSRRSTKDLCNSKLYRINFQTPG